MHTFFKAETEAGTRLLKATYVILNLVWGDNPLFNSIYKVKYCIKNIT